MAKHHDTEVAPEEAGLVPLLCLHPHASPGAASAAPSLSPFLRRKQPAWLQAGSQLCIKMCTRPTEIALLADFQRLCAVGHQQGAAGRGDCAGLAEHSAQEPGAAILPDTAQHWHDQLSGKRARTAHRAEGLEELSEGWAGLQPAQEHQQPAGGRPCWCAAQHCEIDMCLCLHGGSQRGVSSTDVDVCMTVAAKKLDRLEQVRRSFSALGWHRESYLMAVICSV